MSMDGWSHRPHPWVASPNTCLTITHGKLTGHFVFLSLVFFVFLSFVFFMSIALLFLKEILLDDKLVMINNEIVFEIALREPLASATKED